MSTHFLEREFFPFDLLVKNFFDKATNFTPAIDSHPNHPINIFEDENGLTFEIACTGINKDDIEIKVEGDLIQFIYNKKQPQDDEGKKYIIRGIAQRSFNLGYKVSSKFDLAKGVASFKDGLLIVNLPFSAQSKPKFLKIS